MTLLRTTRIDETLLVQDNKTFLICSQNPLLLYYSSTQQHSTPQFKAQLSNNTQMVYISGSNKIVSPFCLEKVRKQVET